MSIIYQDHENIAFNLRSYEKDTSNALTKPIKRSKEESVYRKNVFVFETLRERIPRPERIYLSRSSEPNTRNTYSSYSNYEARGPTGIAGPFSWQDYREGGDEGAVGNARATALRHRSFITPFAHNREEETESGVRRNRKRGGTEKRRESGMEATWLPTAIRGGGRHESHDDVTATIATSRRGQYVSLPGVPCRSLGSVPHRPHHRRCIATNIGTARRCTERRGGEGVKGRTTVVAWREGKAQDGPVAGSTLVEAVADVGGRRRGKEKEERAEGQRRIGKQGGRVPRASAVPLIIGTRRDGRVTPRPDRKLVTPVGSINQPQSYSVLSGTPRKAPRWKLLPPSCPRYPLRRYIPYFIPKEVPRQNERSHATLPTLFNGHYNMTYRRRDAMGFCEYTAYIRLLILADRREKQAYTTECVASTQKGENLEKSSSDIDNPASADDGEKDKDYDNRGVSERWITDFCREDTDVMISNSSPYHQHQQERFAKKIKETDNLRYAVDSSPKMWFGTRLAVARNAAAAILRLVNHSGEHAGEMLTLFTSESAGDEIVVDEKQTRCGKVGGASHEPTTTGGVTELKSRGGEGNQPYNRRLNDKDRDIQDLKLAVIGDFHVLGRSCYCDLLDASKSKVIARYNNLRTRCWLGRFWGHKVKPRRCQSFTASRTSSIAARAKDRQGAKWRESGGRRFPAGGGLCWTKVGTRRVPEDTRPREEAWSPLLGAAMNNHMRWAQVKEIISSVVTKIQRTHHVFPQCEGFVAENVRSPVQRREWGGSWDTKRGAEGTREDGGESGERVALSELRIIITVVVGEMRRHRGCEGYLDDGPGGAKDDGDDERPLPGGWKRVYLLTVVHTGASTENGPRWKSAAFGGTGQENWLTTFRTGSELPNRSPILPSHVSTPFWTIH
ncbi:hypothetical protein DBV15_08173 [Temnothorax longispinosus]|uniref:Uncharacterized protein n=1 Tax=Temnothorax longispinosus TaxID=300112 RepID=A0A4S2K9T4_9HYME|nr:hypothetical protein DBV15_08173 [Temnothorax longispinosus]